MPVRCSLDDFIESNRHEVRVSPFSNIIHFPGTDYRVPPGVLFDFFALQGKGYQLAFPDCQREITESDLRRGIGMAFILDKKGEKTGYHISSHGGQNIDGTGRYHAYYIRDDKSLPGADRRENYRCYLGGAEILNKMPRPRYAAEYE